MSLSSVQCLIQQAKLSAADYDKYKPGELQSIIYRSTREAYFGKRSVEDFLHFMGGLVKDEDGSFYKHNVDTRLHFLCSLKSQDASLEGLAELNLEDPRKEKYETRKANLISMIRGALDQSILSTNDCKIHLPSQLLEDTGVIPSKVIFERRLVRLNTAMLYKQVKFNLARKESIGYTALWNDLTAGSIEMGVDEHGEAQPRSLERIPQFLETISSYIGFFSLDPNRVLDIILDFFVKELLVNFMFWLSLLAQSGWMEFSGEDSGCNPIMAHLLGFKFEHHQLVEAQNASATLYYTCALLLKKGLIQLSDLHPYLRPYESDMEERTRTYMSNMNKEITTSTGGLLAQYGALGEEGTTERLVRNKPRPIDPVDNEGYNANDVVELTKALLSIGDIYHAEMILAKYDKLVDVHLELAHYVYRLCDVLLTSAYNTFATQEIKNKYAHLEHYANNAAARNQLINESELKNVLVTNCLHDGVVDHESKQRKIFFYPDWKETLPRCNTVQDLVTNFVPLMHLAGYKTYLAATIIQKLVLVITCILERQPEFPGFRPYCMYLIREILLPAVSFSRSNPGTMASVWDLLDTSTFQERCALYGEWGNNFYKMSIGTKFLKGRTERSVKGIMQRMAKNDVRQCGRELGKLACSNPVIVFNVMLDQIQAFDNLAPLMADGCRYMSNFPYDVLGYLLTERLTGSQGPGRMKEPKTKEDGMTASWLRALSVFAGMLSKKQGVEASPILRYIACRLRNNDAVEDLVLLNEFITKVAGIEITGNTIMDEQITSAGCCNTIKAETFQPISPENRRASRRVLIRLKEALLNDSIVVEILVLLHRLKEACLTQLTITTGELCAKVNHIHQTILQYTQLLTTLFEGKEYKDLIPTMTTLASDYDLPPQVIMHMIRPITQHAFKNYQPDKHSTEHMNALHPVFQPIIQEAPNIVQDPAIFEAFTPEFYAIFCQLSLYDIHVSEKHYEAAMKKHTDIIAQCRDTRSAFYQNNRASQVAKAERQAQASLESLQEELSKHRACVARTMQMLRSSQSRWFPTSVDRLSLTSRILQHCLLSRSIMSEVDAVFCFEFIMLMHSLGALNLSSFPLLTRCFLKIFRRHCYLSPGKRRLCTPDLSIELLPRCQNDTIMKNSTKKKRT